jgi:hypothetical protein
VRVQTAGLRMRSQGGPETGANVPVIPGIHNFRKGKHRGRRRPAGPAQEATSNPYGAMERPRGNSDGQSEPVVEVHLAQELAHFDDFVRIDHVDIETIMPR